MYIHLRIRVSVYVPVAWSIIVLTTRFTVWDTIHELADKVKDKEFDQITIGMLGSCRVRLSLELSQNIIFLNYIK
jgi:hypothetical protein